MELFQAAVKQVVIKRHAYSCYKENGDKCHAIRGVPLKCVFNYFIEFVVKFWSVLCPCIYKIAVVKRGSSATNKCYVMQSKNDGVDYLFC